MIATIVDGLDHPECVALGPDGAIYAGGEDGQLYLVDPISGTFQELASTHGWVLGIAVDSSSRVVVCDPKNRSVMLFVPGSGFVTLSTGTTARPMTNPNFPVFDANGFLYVSDSGVWPSGGGCIYRIDPDGVSEVWSEATPQFTNGLALDSEQTHLYVVESTLPGVTRIPINKDGSAGIPELVVSMPGTVPDGIAFDVQGRLYIGCYRPDRVYSLEPNGRLLILRDDFQGTDLAAPTNLAFAGDDRKDLLIASLGRWHIAKIRVAAPGQPLHFPSGLWPFLNEQG